MANSAVADLAYHVYKKIDNTQIFATQCSTLDREKGTLTSYDNYLIQKNVDKPKKFHHKFSFQIYTANELQEMLARNGFETVAQYELNGSELVNNKTLSILTVARKGAKSAHQTNKV